MAVYHDKKRKRWRYEIQVRGRRYVGYAETMKEALGAQEKRRGRVGAHSEIFRDFGALVAKYIQSSQRTNSAAWTYQKELKLEKGFGHLAKVPVEELRRGHFETALDDLSAGGNSALSVNEYRKIVHAVMEYAVELEAIDRNPVSKIPRMMEDAPRVEPIEGAHLKQLILAADSDTSALLRFLSQTGARWIEAYRLRWPEVFLDRPDPFCILTTRKTGKRGERKRPQPLTKLAISAILMQTGKGREYVFSGPAGGRLPYNTAFKRLQKLCTDLKLPPYSFHQVRHWTGMVATSMGKSKKAVAEFLGHSDTHATELYMHALAPELWEVARRLEQEMGEVATSGIIPPGVLGVSGGTSGGTPS